MRMVKLTAVLATIHNSRMACDGCSLDDYRDLMVESVKALPGQVDLVRCRECKYFETDHFENASGVPLILAHNICKRWGDGCKTNQNGYCFMAERRDDATD